MATKGKLDPYSDIRPRQVNTNMSGGSIGLSAARQQLASAKQLGQSVLSVADEIAAYGKQRQRQKDIEGSLGKLEQLSLAYDQIFEEEKQKWVDEPEESLTERVSKRIEAKKQEFSDEQEFTSGERDLFNVGAARAAIQIKTQAFTSEKAQDRVIRSLAFEKNIDLASTRAYNTKDSKLGLTIWQFHKDVLLNKIMIDPKFTGYSPETQKTLLKKLSNIALSTAEGMMYEKPKELIDDINNGLYDEALSPLQPTTKNTLLNKAYTELRRKNAGSDTTNHVIAQGQIAQIWEGKSPDAFKKIEWNNQERAELFKKELGVHHFAASLVDNIGVKSASKLAEDVSRWKTVKEDLDDVERAYAVEAERRMNKIIGDFNKAIAEDPIEAMSNYNPGLLEGLNPLNMNDGSRIKQTTKWQKDQGILSSNIRLVSNAYLNQLANDMQLTKKNINAKDLRNHGSVESMRQVLLKLSNTWGPDYSRIIGELQHHSKEYTISETEIVASAFIEKPDLFALMIKTNLMNEEDWKTFGLKPTDITAIEEAVSSDPALRDFLDIYDGFQRPAALGKAMQDVGKALAYLHRMEDSGKASNIASKVREMFIGDVGMIKLGIQDRDKPRSIPFQRIPTTKEEKIFQQNMHDPDFFLKHGALQKIPGMTTQLTGLLYANILFPCPTTNGDGNYNLCYHDDDAIAFPRRRVLTNSGELASITEDELFTSMDPTRSRLDQAMVLWGRRNTGWGFGAGLENVVKGLVLFQRLTIEAQKEFLGEIPGGILTVDNAAEFLATLTPEVPSDAVKPLYPGLNLEKIKQLSTPVPQEKIDARKKANEARYEAKKQGANSFLDKTRELVLKGKNMTPSSMDGLETSIKELLKVTDEKQKVNPNKVHNIEKLLSDIRTAIEIKDNKAQKTGLEKLIIELRYPYDQGNTDGNTDTKLDDFEQTVKNGKLLKTTAENDQANEIDSLPQKEKTLESVIETLDERAKKNPNDVINGMIKNDDLVEKQPSITQSLKKKITQPGKSIPDWAKPKHKKLTKTKKWLDKYIATAEKGLQGIEQQTTSTGIKALIDIARMRFSHMRSGFDSGSQEALDDALKEFKNDLRDIDKIQKK